MASDAIRARDPLAERAFLLESQRLARITTANWPTIVANRLQWGEKTHGDSWTLRGLPGLIREIREEGVDAGAWACLTAQALSSEELDADVHTAVTDLLAQAAAAGAAIYALTHAVDHALRKHAAEKLLGKRGS